MSEERRFSSDDAEGDYRVLSKFAVGALMFGLLSPLAMVSEVTWALPILSLILGAVALWSIRRDPKLWAGAGVAFFGMLLAGFFLAFVVSDTWKRQDLLAKHAREHAETWLNLLRESGDDPAALYRADQLMQPYEHREADGVPLALHYAEPETEQINSITPMALEQMPGREMQRTFDGEPLKSLVASLQAGGSFRFEGIDTIRYAARTDVEQVAPIFRITDADGQDRRLIVVMRRKVYDRIGRASESHWKVDGVRPVGAVLPSPY